VLASVAALASLSTIACGSLLGLGDDDDADGRPTMTEDGGADATATIDFDGDTTTPTGDAAAPDAGRVLPDAGKLVFVSSKTAVAAFDGGAAGAHVLCNSLATASGITGRTFRAYLELDGLLGSGNTTAGLFSEDGWLLTNGKLAFAGPVIGLDPDVALAVDEKGQPLDAAAGAWVGSSGLLGLLGAETCADWTSTNGDVRVGDPHATDRWDDDGTRACSVPRHLYCFEE
jgi:hypothetical protein